MRVLITGADGFVASHLIDHLINDIGDVEVFGTIRRLANRKNIQQHKDNIKLIDMELTDYNSVENAMKIANPDKIFHLAAATFVPYSWESPLSTYETNVIGTCNVLEVMRKTVPKAYIMIQGTSEEYGMVYPEECPMTEAQPLRPMSPYGVSKVATDRMGYQYAKSYNLNCLISRSFNMTGPRRGSEFVDSNFARQIVEIEKHNKEPIIYHGNLTAVRDFTDVRDSVRAYWMLSEKQWNGEVVNICSGVGKSMNEVLSTLISKTNYDGVIETREDPKRMRPSDVPLLLGDNRLLKSYVNWKPEIEWERSMNDLLAYWRNV